MGGIMPTSTKTTTSTTTSSARRPRYTNYMYVFTDAVTESARACEDEQGEDTDGDQR